MNKIETLATKRGELLAVYSDFSYNKDKYSKMGESRGVLYDERSQKKNLTNKKY